VNTTCPHCKFLKEKYTKNKMIKMAMVYMTPGVRKQNNVVVMSPGSIIKHLVMGPSSKPYYL